MLSNQQFDRARRLASNLAGIELVERHRELLDRRSRRFGILSGADLDSLLSAAEDGQTAASQRLLCLLTTKFTGFFRHPRHFDIAADHALRAAQQCGRARLWCAAAATGEEAYSLAMRLIEVFRGPDPPATLLATDLDKDALAVAQRGEYGEPALRALDIRRRGAFFCESSGARRYRIAPAVRCLVDFRPLNLASTAWPVEGPFDVIFCRNVLMYLEARHRYAVLDRMASLLAPEGLLMLDPAEHPGKAGHLFTPGDGGVYARGRASCPPWGVTRDDAIPRQ
jgi:chemotaxis protein methyltransferase CheR